MDKFQPSLPVPQGVQNGQVGRLKLSVDPQFAALRCSLADLVVPDVRHWALQALLARVRARLAAGEPVALAADPFRPYRDPTASEPVMVMVPAVRCGPTARP